jgi:hypothetical protein
MTKLTTGHDGEDEKQDLGNFDSACCNTAEAEHGGDQCDHQENDGIVQHLGLLALWRWRALLRLKRLEPRLKRRP